MKNDALLLIILIMVFSCSKNYEIRTKKDIVFGLELGMSQDEVNNLINDRIKEDPDSYYVSDLMITQYRGSDDKKIEMNFYQPIFKDSILTKYSYTLQVITLDEEYLAEFHKQILDELKYQYGNARTVDFEDQETTLKWDLAENETLQLQIDKIDNLYALTYELRHKD
jgi:hypothetical protein